MLVWRGLARTLVALVAAALVWAGCSDSGGSGGAQGCTTSGDCTKWRCACKDGSATSIAECASHTCVEGADACGNLCNGHGGLAAATPLPNVSTSPECDAFCAKAQSLGCSGDPRCDRSFWCGLASDECPEQKRAHLQCQVDEGTWKCLPGNGWSVSSSCASATCPADAGAD